MEVRNSEDNDEEVLVIVIKLELEHNEQGNIIETVPSKEELSSEEENLQNQQRQMMVLNCEGSKSCSSNPPFDTDDKVLTDEPVWKKRKLCDSEESFALDGDDFPAISGVTLEPSGELKPMNKSAKSRTAMAFVDDQSTIKIKDYRDKDSSCIEKNDSNENVKNKCSKCLKYFTNEKSYWLHIDDEHPEVRNPRPLICNMCETIFTTKPRLISHMEKFHNKLDAPTKQKSLPTKLRKTPNTSEDKTYLESNSAQKIQNKLPQNNNGRKCQCLHYQNSESPLGHHTHLCDYEGCEKTFKKMFEFKVHLRTHTGERPYACDWVGCEKRFAMAYRKKGILTLTWMKNLTFVKAVKKHFPGKIT